MHCITAPDDFGLESWEKSVFLAGGITGCPEWQKEMIEMLSDRDYVLFNPRRDDFPMDDPYQIAGQITWEFSAMRVAKAILFLLEFLKWGLWFWAIYRRKRYRIVKYEHNDYVVQHRCFLFLWCNTIYYVLENAYVEFSRDLQHYNHSVDAFDALRDWEPVYVDVPIAPWRWLSGDYKLSEQEEDDAFSKAFIVEIVDRTDRDGLRLKMLRRK